MGYRVNIIFCFSSVFVMGLYLLLLRWENKKKEEKIKSGEADKLTEEELRELGDASPFFKYRY